MDKLTHRIILFLVFVISLFTVGMLVARHYGQSLCRQPGYTCIRVNRGDTWNRLFPNPKDQMIVRRVNRMNTHLYPGMIIAVPKNLGRISHMNVSPLPFRLEPTGSNFLLINLRLQAFGTYDRYGYLVHWGPVSGGRGYCPDIHRRCSTPVGSFRIVSKQGAGCISKKYPVPTGGAPMPYCMFFYGGFAMHGSTLPGYHASHGCIRLFNEDARWLNQEFAGIGTRVIVRW